MKYTSYIIMEKKAGNSTLRKALLRLAYNHNRILLFNPDEARVFVADLLTKVKNILEDYNEDRIEPLVQTTDYGHVIHVPTLFEMRVFTVENYER
jgi:hypothetical protein